jgi:hypothetical protein
MQTYGAVPDRLQREAADRIANLINHQEDQTERAHKRYGSPRPRRGTSTRPRYRPV